jgi:2-polyprenyl-3-methyl-5-hydroxy-6-metoxy-1,4-benzoquinol methylase
MFKNLDRCLCCDSNDLKEVLNLGDQTLANNYHHKDEQLDRYPLKLNLCRKCYHLQLTVSVDPDIMFKNYLYVSGTSKTLNEYFERFANKIQKMHPRAKSILDIACNDGTQLDYFSKLGFDTYGIDPAENLYPISSKKGHVIYCDYFNKNSIKNIDKTFDVILAQNVFAHNSNPLEFLMCAKELLNDNGKIYIQTSQANMIKNNEFDTIYHEHISFFNLKSMQELCKRAGLNLVNNWKEDIHGTSYIFEIDKMGLSSVNLLFEEFLYNEEIYEKYAKRCYEIRNEFNLIIKDLSKSHMLVGYGAAAKGNTFLNFAYASLDYIVDDNPLKCGLLTPGSNIPIVDPKILEFHAKIPTVYIPLAWNFHNEIKNKINSKTNSKNLYLKYFPRVEITYE